MQNNILKENNNQTETTNVRSHRVAEVQWHTRDLFELKIERDSLEFIPGDCVSIFHPSEKISRPYSIASGTNEPHLSFLIRCMPEGVMTRWLAELKPGDEISISPPYGWFRPGEAAENGHPFVFVATGTGIAPFLSYLRSFPEKAPVGVYYGIKTLSEAVGAREINKNCPLHLAISREKQPEYFYGRVTQLLEMNKVNPDAHYYLCGLDSMIEDVTRLLESKGVSSFNIHTEVFFHASSE